MPGLRWLAPMSLAVATVLGSANVIAAPAAPAAPAATPSSVKAAPAATRDPFSYANTEDFLIEHLALDLAVDFDRKVLEGSATLHLKPLKAEAVELVLDTRALAVAQVETATAGTVATTATTAPTTGAAKVATEAQRKKEDSEAALAWTDAHFTLEPADALRGSALRIAMPAAADRVRIRYRTSPEASGLQWLAPAQTAGKRQPFLFSQSQAIHARSWVPLQDTPAVRFTYEARIRTPKALRALMSADNDPKALRDSDYRFTMPQRIPSYLMALAVGDLKFARLGNRTGIYAEPSVLPAAAREFADSQTMLERAEGLFGAYRWGRYDLLILPPSFPFGGMENPRLTFATPTVIAGDKSLVALVAHELAHSWSGNLVTNASWRDFWLNESFTSYLTNRIMESVFGTERADMERSLEATELLRELPEVPAAQRALRNPAGPENPDDSPAVVAYNRGSLFLYNLELAFGRARFDAFLKSWFDEHAFSSQTTEVFVAFLDERLLRAQPGVFPLARALAWIDDVALPADAVIPQSAAFARVAAAREAFLAGRIGAKQLDAKQWNTLHWSYFLDNLPAVPAITSAQLADLDATYGLSASRNAVLQQSWLQVAIANRYAPADAAVRRHLAGVGRIWLIRPVYQALVATPAGLAEAEAIYAKARAGYHPITQAALDKVLAEARAKAASGAEEEAGKK